MLQAQKQAALARKAKKLKDKNHESAATKASRAALDPDPPPPIDNAVPLPERRRALIASARPPPPRLLSKAAVLALVPVSYPCLWAMMLRGEFPRSRSLAPGSNRVGWVESEVLAWIESRPVQKLKGDGGGMKTSKTKRRKV
jgi:predicted DNA-binding transcriptional regulator AlpA